MTTETILRDYITPIAVAFLLAFLLDRFSWRIVQRFMGLSDLAPKNLRFRQERKHTLRDLFSSVLGFIGYAFAIVFTLSLFIDTTALIWMIGLFSGGLGFGAKPLISDYLTGISFIFEDSFDVGEKVQLMEVEGVVEKINLRTTILRSPTGEVYVIPNGEVRLIRNFSRGLFSTADIVIKVAARDLDVALNVLNEVANDAMIKLPDMLEPWRVISEHGAIGEHAELKLVVKARYGTAADLRPRLLALVQKRLGESEIALI